MKDFLGQELNVGDNVVNIRTYGQDKSLEQGIITKIGTSMATIKNSYKEYNKTPSKILKIDTILNNLNKPKEL